MVKLQAQKSFVVMALLVLICHSLQGCAPLIAVAGMRVGTEVAGSHAVAGMKVTGAELRQGADFSYSYPKHVDVKLALDHADWTCYRGKGSYGGQELCLLPAEAGKFGDRTWFECRYGRGGSLTYIVTQDHTYYCTLSAS